MLPFCSRPTQTCLIYNGTFYDETQNNYFFGQSPRKKPAVRYETTFLASGKILNDHGQVQLDVPILTSV